MIPVWGFSPPVLPVLHLTLSLELSVPQCRAEVEDPGGKSISNMMWAGLFHQSGSKPNNHNGQGEKTVSGASRMWNFS